MIPIKLYIGLFFGVGALCLVMAIAAGQPTGVLMGLFFLGWGAVVWYLKYGRATVVGQPTRPNALLGRATACETVAENSALNLLQQDKTYEHTHRMVKAIPALARELLSAVREESARVQNAQSWYIECVLDLELTGAFHRALNFCRDAALASLFVDALLFEATGQKPTVPEDIDVMSGLTHLYRGIGKYVIAKSTLSLHPVEIPLRVFGLEYAAALQSPFDPTLVREARSRAAEIREAAFYKASGVLVRGLVVPNAEYVKPTSSQGAEYIIRPGMQLPSKFKDQPEEYKNAILGALKQIAQGQAAPD